MKHHCHATGCKTACAPAMLMCRPCWRLVPKDIQDEVYRTVRLRDKKAVDESWASWWRARARAIYHVANLRIPSEKVNATLARELAFAAELESRKVRLDHA